MRRARFLSVWIPAVLVLACGSGTDDGDGDTGDGDGDTGDGDGDTGDGDGDTGDGDGDGDSSGGASGTIDVDAACTTEVSCIVRSGEGQDSAWLENEMARCAADGFGSVDRPGTWHEEGACPEGDYFAACTKDDSQEHFLLVDFDRTLEELEERCISSGGVWEIDDTTEPAAIRSIDAAEVITPLSEYHPEVLTTMHPNQLCSMPSPDGLVGISETVSGSIAEYFNFVCVGGKAIQNINDFTQSASERYSLASEVPSASLSVGILDLDEAYYIFTSRGPNWGCWNCGTSFSVALPAGSQGTATELIVIDNAGRERSLTLTQVTAAP